MSAVSVIKCNDCGFTVTGFRCLGMRPPTMQINWEGDSYYGYRLDDSERAKIPTPTTGCGKLLIPTGNKVNDKVELVCPSDSSHGKMIVACGGKCSSTSLVNTDTETANNVNNVLSALPPLSSNSPALTCTSCGFTFDGVLCMTNHNDPKPLPRNGFFERVWCSYIWSCSEGCSRDKESGLMPRYKCLYIFNSCILKYIHLTVNLGSTCNTNTSPLDYVEKNGPPTN